MEKRVIVTAKTVEEAQRLAAEQLGVAESMVRFTVLEEPKKGLFGAKKDAKVEAVVDMLEEAPAPEEPASSPAALSEEHQNKLRLAQEYLTSVLCAMSLPDITQTVTVEEDSAVINLEGDGVGVIIGRRGETLDSLQYLTSLVANRGGGSYFRITLDSGNYREKRKEALRGLARRISRSALKTGRSSTLEPMNPYERRIIHSAISEIEGVESKSIGEEPNRRVVISSLNPQPSGGGDRRSRRRRDRDRGFTPTRYDKKTGEMQKGDFVSIKKSSFEEEYKNRQIDRSSIYLDADEADAAFEEMDKKAEEALKEKAAEVKLYGKIEL